jgi:opacity protein-like surface antigen
MKTKAIGRILLLSLLSLSMNSNAQTFSQGDMIFDVIAGGPNFSKAFVGGDFTLDSDESETVTGLLPVGLRGEFMLTDKFGIGLEITYASGKRVYDYSLGTDMYMDTWEHNKLRILPTFNFHFLDSDMIDLYGALGVGMKNVNYSWESTDIDGFDGLELPTGKISSKLAIGMRVFFTDNIGANLAFGLGGPLVNGGLSLRI